MIASFRPTIRMRPRGIRGAASACLTGLLVAAPIIAQPAPTDPLTLPAAMERAFAANPTIAAARLNAAINRAGLAVAREWLNPEASIEIEKETPKQSFGLAVPLELGGKRAKRIAVSRAAMATGDAELAAIIAQVRNEVRRAYYAVVIADARLHVLRDLRDLSQRARDTAQARFETGDAPRLEVLQADLALAAAENEAAALESTGIAARSRLNALLGQPLETVQPLSTAIDAGGPVVTATVLDLARTGSTELSVLDRRIEERRLKVALAQAQRVPDLTPSATLTHDAEPEFTYGWRVGLAVTLPVFTTHKAGVLVEQTTLDQLMAERQAALARIDGEVTAAAATAEAQRLAYIRYRDMILPKASEVDRLAQDSYQLGQTGIAALLQALQASRDIRLRSIDTSEQFQQSFADLERAVGAPLP
jgi:cobalt-zinc-cadmium efflux system outer membrane protein